MGNNEQAVEVAALIVKFLKAELTEEEEVLLTSWRAASDTNDKLFAELTDGEYLREELLTMESLSLEKAWEKLSKDMTGNSSPLIPIASTSKTWWKYAAAVAALVIAVASYFLFIPRSSNNEMLVTAGKQVIKPGKDQAILQLADGTVIALDSASNGELADQSAAKVIKLDNKLIYKNAHGSDAEGFNTITTPRGGQFQLVLADGTKVWLNAASSIRFPLVFRDGQRRLEVSGEVYLEVKKDLKRPFIVSIPGKGEVEVLGTSFNVNAYADEEALNTTLVEGLVKFTSTSGESARILPGQQASLSRTLKVRPADVEEVTAWRTGWFQFNHAAVPQIMRQISRWYDVDIKFEGKPVNKTFSGLVSRNNDIGDVLDIMERAGVKFRIEGKTIVVL